MDKNKSWSPLKIVLVSVLSVVLIFILITGVFAIGIYKYDWENNATKAFTKIIPFPSAIVNWKIVSVYDYRILEKLRKSYKEFKDGKLNTEELKKLKAVVLDEMINREVIRQEAKKLGISVTNQELETLYKESVEANGGEAKLKESLEKNYKSTLLEFKNELEVQRLIKEVREKVVSDESFDAPVRAKAEDILKQIKGGADFAEMAKKYSQDPTAASGGDLGWIGKGKMVKEFEDAAFNLKAGEISGVTKDVYGYHIIQVLEVRTNDKGEPEVHARDILIKTKDFDDWLKEKRDKAKIWKFL